MVTLLAGGITITKEGQVLSKLNPQAGASAEEQGSQRSNGPANRQEQKGERPVYLQRDILFSLDIVGRALVLPRSNVTYPL